MLPDAYFWYGLSPESCATAMPPPPPWVMLLVMCESLIFVWAYLPNESMPPPRMLAVLPLTVEPLRARSAGASIAPPAYAELPVRVVSAMSRFDRLNRYGNGEQPLEQL